MKYDWSERRVRDAVNNSFNYCDTLRFLGVPVRGNNISTLKNNIKKYKIDIAHFTGRIYKRGPVTNQYIPAQDYLGKSARHIQSGRLRRKLISEGIKDYKCDSCGISEWNGKEITLQLHHIDGDETNNQLDNIQFLCPNCHSQTVNYRGNKTMKSRNYCMDCGIEIGRQSKRCPKCSANNRRKLPISNEELIAEYAEIKNSVALAKKYGVSEAAIRKHIGKL